MLEKAKNPEFWRLVQRDGAYAMFREDLIYLYENFCREELPAVKFSEYRIFYQTGSRMEYENSYFARRVRLNTLALLTLIYPENESYLSGLEDVIWAVCDEYCWALPAHVRLEDGNDNTFIDLFASETGFALSEIHELLSGRLSPLVSQRIRAEVERRIVESFLTRRFGFEEATNNWAAVCSAGVGASYLYLRPDLFEQVKPRLDHALERFFTSFCEDGVCREGTSYWSYGFGFFTFYADLLKEFTAGEIDLFEDPKVEAIASFQHKAYLRENITASYADGSIYNTHVVGLTHYLKARYPQSVRSLPSRYRLDRGILERDVAGRARWAYELRSILWYQPELDVSASERDAVYFLEASAWYIKKSEAYAFTAKAGDNDEPHNHNDVGGFILATDEGQNLCDLGAGEYTRQYFGPERYQFLCNRSGGHSVPIVNGQEQKNGAEYAGLMRVEGNTVEIEMQDAYEAPGLSSLKRTFVLDSRRVALTDAYVFDGGPLPVTERFVTQIQPERAEGSIRIGCVTLRYDAERWDAAVRNEQWSNHLGASEPVYLIDFQPKGEQDRFEACFDIEG